MEMAAMSRTDVTTAFPALIEKVAIVLRTAQSGHGGASTHSNPNRTLIPSPALYARAVTDTRDTGPIQVIPAAPRTRFRHRETKRFLGNHRSMYPPDRSVSPREASPAQAGVVWPDGRDKCWRLACDRGHPRKAGPILVIGAANVATDSATTARSTPSGGSLTRRTFGLFRWNAGRFTLVSIDYASILTVARSLPIRLGRLSLRRRDRGDAAR